MTAPLRLSVIVVVYDMQREAPRTLRSLTTPYQQGISTDEYEVLVVENGGSRRLDPAAVTGLGRNFHYEYRQNASGSPAPAINAAMARARGEVVGVMIDGARICTPGLLRSALDASGLYPRTVVATPGFYLGKGFQRYTIMAGYDQRAEDELLRQIGWPEQGYRLFEIGSLDESSHLTERIAESNALFMKHALWSELGGFDEKFDLPGGGLVNLDTLTRACELPDTELVILLGEGTFHQVHGGVATNSAPEVFELRFEIWAEQYRRLRGRHFDRSHKLRRYLGTLPRAILPFIAEEVDAVAPSAAAKVKLEAELLAARDRLAALEAERDLLRQELGLLQGSHSWYLTRPLRSFYQKYVELRSRMAKPNGVKGP